MKVAVLSLVDPWSQAHGGTLRTRGLATALADLGHEVTCIFHGEAVADGRDPRVQHVAVAGRTAGTALPGRLSQAKRYLLPVPTAAGAASPALYAAVRDARADMVVTVELALARSARNLAPRLWNDHSDVWSRLAAREARFRRGVGRATALAQARQVGRQERALGTEAAVVSAAGWMDARSLEQTLGRTVHWMPTPVVTARPRVTEPPGNKVAGFIANFEYWPNVDAYNWLARRWAPRLRQLGYRVVVAGLESARLPPAPGVENLGALEDVATFYDMVDVALAPIRRGGGMKVKVIESLLHRRPVLATDFAAEGFPPEVRAAIDVVGDAGEVLPAPGEVSFREVDLDAFTAAGFRRATERALEGVA